jgi:alpha-L-rhamnosidase
MYGPVSSAWEIKEGRFRLDVEIPPNASATVRLPNAKLADVIEGSAPADKADGVARLIQEGQSVQLEVASGRYSFTYPWTQ